MANIIGEPLAEYVANQIKIRQKIHGSGTLDNPRTPEYISYLNSKTAWIKMASGVYVKDDRIEIKNKDIRGNLHGMELAKNFILFDGVSRLNQKDQILNPRGTSTSKNNIWDPYDGTYNVNAKSTIDSNIGEFGLTPMPGIESFEIRCLNRGSIKKASMKIKCYSPEQFQIIDLLYLRIGYTMFVEWGWAPYLKNDGSLATDYFTLIEQEGEGFFGIDYWKSKSYLDFLKRIEKKRANLHANYDGFLCRVTNFSWTFNQDGSYDIDLQLISLGDVIESLKMNITPSYKTAKYINDAYKIFNDDYTSYDKEQTTDAPPSPISNIISAYFFLQKLYLYQKRQDIPYWKRRDIPCRINGQAIELYGVIIAPPEDSENTINVEKVEGFYFESSAQEWLNENHPTAVQISDFDTFSLKTSPGTYYYVENQSLLTDSIGSIAIEGKYIVYVKSILDLAALSSGREKADIVYFNYNTQKDDEDTLNDEGFYIRFGYLLDFLKQNVIPKINGTNSTSGEAPIIDIDSGQWSNRMYTFPYQVSLDPRVCIVHTQEKVNTKEYYTSLPVWKKENRDYAYPMNIYLSFNKVNEIISSNLDEKGNLALFDFLSSICTELNKALGGLNNLEPIVDETSNLLKIIDASYSPTYKKPDYALELFGYNKNNPNQSGTTVSNFVRNFNIKTEITNDFATMATVGSTAGGYVKGTENTMFSRWNKGLVDVWKEKLIPANKNSREKDGETPEPNQMYVEEFWNRRYSAFGLTIPVDVENDFFTQDQPSLLPEVIDRNIAVVTEFYKYCHSEIQKKKELYGSPTNGFIPISLSLTLDGIAGIKIYNALNIVTRFLPNNYPDALKFIIKGVNHKVSDNDWETTIETVVISRNEDEDGKILTYDKIYSIVKNLIGQGATAAAEAKLSPSVKETILPSINPPLPNETKASSNSKLEKSTKEAAQQQFKEEGTNDRYCGGFTFKIASRLASKLTGGKRNMSGGNDAYSVVLRTNLSNLNIYQPESLTPVAQNLSASDARKKAAEITKQANYGDVLIYFGTKPGPPQKINNKAKYHAQIFTGDLYKENGGIGWSTSNKNNYGTSFVYRSGFNYTMYWFRIKDEYKK